MIDTHCHIDDEAFASDREFVIARQREAGVQSIVVPGVGVESVQSVMTVCHTHPHYCYPALGLHPEEVKVEWQDKLLALERAIRVHANELVAIGEIGLDYYWDKTYQTEQQMVLRRQLELAAELRLPVILHNRESTEDIIRIVREKKRENEALMGVFHCFNGSMETAQQILELDFYLGIGGVLTFKNCKLSETLAALAETPKYREGRLLNHLLLETDAPYMSPVPHRGERNESRYITHVAHRLAEVLDVSEETVLNVTTANAKRLFALK